MSYSKLYSSLVHSSLWTEADDVRILFITLLAICDRNGYVYGSKKGIERLANIIVDENESNPWEVLMSPDPDSSDLLRNPENEGRRIEEVPGGFHLLNFEYYRGLRNDDDRRGQNRVAQARFKARTKLQSARVSQDKPESAGKSQGEPISEAEAEADNANLNRLASPPAASPLDFLDQLKALDVYKGIDIDKEIGHMKAWLLTPKGKGRTLTKQFVVNWLNKCDSALDLPDPSRPKTRAQLEYEDFERRQAEKGAA